MTDLFEQNWLLHLPEEIFELILEYLDLESLSSLSKMYEKWKEKIMNPRQKWASAIETRILNSWGFTRMYPSDNEITLALDLGITLKKCFFLTFIFFFI